MNRGPLAKAANVQGAWLRFILGLPILLLAVSLLTRSSDAAPCTPGTNCYCDRVKSGDLKDSSVLLCEDFEAPTLYNNQGVGNGAPYYGPWYDNAGQPGNRGMNSYWARVYGNGVSGALFSLGTPASPTFGAPCAFSLCTGMKVWDPSNRWTANAFNPLAVILRNGEFNAEISSLTSPTNATGGGSGPFDGTASFGHRIPAGSVHGIIGLARWGRVTTFGATIAMAFPVNMSTQNPVANANWKFNEWVYNLGQAGGDGLLGFGLAGTLNTSFPFYGFVFGRSTSVGGDTFQMTPAICNARLATATQTTGAFSCDAAGNFIWQASSAQYSRPTDWPLGTWGCMRGYYQNMGLTNSAIQVWFTGPSGVEKKVIDISNMDTSGHTANFGNTPGYVGLSWNAYANTNQGDGGTPTTQTTFRYEDNFHVRAGTPVPCSQIGFGSSGGTAGSSGGTVDRSSPPAPPSVFIK